MADFERDRGNRKRRAMVPPAFRESAALVDGHVDCALARAEVLVYRDHGDAVRSGREREAFGELVVELLVLLVAVDPDLETLDADGRVAAGLDRDRRSDARVVGRPTDLGIDGGSAGWGAVGVRAGVDAYPEARIHPARDHDVVPGVAIEVTLFEVGVVGASGGAAE